MAAPPARVMVDTPAGKKSVAATSSAARSAAPAQKTYNYHKPAEEPFRAPPVQKTFNYHKPAATPAAAPNRAEAYRLATKAEAERPVLKAPKITYETTGQALSRLRGAADNYAQQNLERDRPSSDYVDMPWSEYLPKLARGVLPSALEMGIDAGEMADKAVKDPIGTGKAVLGGLGDLAVGLGSKISDSARSAMGLEVDPFASESKQRALNDLIDSAKGRYGFGEPGEFWKNLADDPASYIADAAAVTTGGLSAAKKVANIADTRQLRRIANETRQTDVAPVTPPAANPPDPFYDPLPPPPNFLMDRPEGYDPFAALRPQNNRMTPEQVDAEVDRIFGPQPLGNVTGPDTEAYAALETAYDNEVPEPYFLVPDNNMGGYGITPDQRALEQEQLLAAHQDYQQTRANTDWLPYIDDNPLDDPAFRPLNYIDDIFPTILERAQRRDPLTEQEAFDVMTFERYGLDGVYDPTNTFENWGQQTNNDREGAERIAYLTGADRHAGQNPVAPVEGPYFANDPEFIDFDDEPDYDVTGYPPLPELHTMTPYRTLEELSADPEYQNLITADTLTTEQAQRLLDATFDEYLHRVDDVSPPDDTSYYDIMTRLEYLTGSEGYRAYAEGMGDPPTRRPQLRPDISSRIRPRLKPLTEAKTGIASMYSPTRRAVDQLRQSRFPDPVSMEKQLLAMGAKPDELEILLKKIGTSDVAEGGIKKLRMAELADEVSNSIQQFRGPDILYGRRHLEGGTDPHVTTFEAPVNNVPEYVQGNQHFTPKLPGSAVLAHIRSAMFKTPGSASNNVYHLGEIQSDWAQFRAKLFADKKQAQEALLEVDKRIAELEAAGKNPQIDSVIAALARRTQLTEKYGFRPEFDKAHPAPFVKTTRKWHQLGLKQALIEAVNSGADYMSMSTGKQVKSYTHGKLEGQQKFYDEMTPREFDDILTKFSKEAGVEKPVIEQITIEGEDSGFTWPPAAKHTVPAIRLTDEFKEAMKKYGLPSFAKGGIVTLPT